MTHRSHAFITEGFPAVIPYGPNTQSILFGDQLHVAGAGSL